MIVKEAVTARSEWWHHTSPAIHWPVSWMYEYITCMCLVNLQIQFTIWSQYSMKFKKKKKLSSLYSVYDSYDPTWVSALCCTTNVRKCSATKEMSQWHSTNWMKCIQRRSWRWWDNVCLLIGLPTLLRATVRWRLDYLISQQITNCQPFS